MTAASIFLTAINRFPVKSFRGEALTSATVEPWGLAGDRRWMIIDAGGVQITAREHPRLALAHAQFIGAAGGSPDGLWLFHPDRAPISVPTPDGASLIGVRVWSSELLAAPAGAAADAWISAVLGVPARLVYLDDPTRRPTNELYSLANDRVSFADGYPLLLATEESLAAVNDWIARGPLAAEGPLAMIRFRPSLVVRGAPAWDEDRWRRIRVGKAIFRAVKGSARCVFTTIDPETAVKGKEPIATLSRYRKWDGKTWFAMNLIPDNPGVQIRLGDEIEILDSVESDGPPR